MVSKKVAFLLSLTYKVALARFESQRRATFAVFRKATPVHAKYAYYYPGPAVWLSPKVLKKKKKCDQNEGASLFIYEIHTPVVMDQ